MVIAWRARDVAAMLGVPPDQEVEDIRLSLDGEAVEVRTRDKGSIGTSVSYVVSYGNDSAL